MALQLSKDLPSGFSADYWRIESVDLVPGTTRVIVAIYKDSAARQAGKAAVSQADYSWTADDNPCTLDAMDSGSNAFALAYEKLKTLPEFAGAQDV